MTFKPGLDTSLALCCMRPVLPGNWKLVDESKSWEDFSTGRVSAVRTIRHRGKRYWVTVGMNEIDGFAKLVAYGLLANPKTEYNAFFNLYSTDPRQQHPVHAATLGGVGVITRIDKAIRRTEEFATQLKSK